MGKLYSGFCFTLCGFSNSVLAFIIFYLVHFTNNRNLTIGCTVVERQGNEFFD